MQADQALSLGRMRKRLKLRRLARSPTRVGDQLIKEQQSIACNFLRQLKCILFATFFLSLAAAVLLGHHLTQNNAKNSSLIQDFVSSYRRHYYQIVYGKPHYCDADLDAQSMFARIREHQILNQEQALLTLESILGNNTQFRSIAIVGSSGVGKTMTANALEEHFPWRENVWTYAWNTHVENEVQKFRMLRFYVEKFSDCGGNLLIIDNLAPCDNEVVPLLNQMIATQDNANKKRFIVLYIFQLNAMIDANSKLLQKNALQNLPDTTTINFKSFNEKQLRDCIRREALLENLSLSGGDFDEIAATIDVVTSGCKKVHPKVLVYGQRLEEEIQSDEF
ncbi:uncharacterized protein LOC128858208 [Anastrepha ludens]|uniref:uncharacterized protein LOC128858208 n=1 Tax=Anastrepha ludens TaxID=28586 RepID=UPI0023AF506C|nr:uncharacterized protein LOC128858208 [Anastrepha ludens]